MNRAAGFIVLTAACVALSGCGHDQAPKAPETPPRTLTRITDPWRLTSGWNVRKHTAFVAGDGIGAWFGPAGDGIGADGTRLPLILGDAYDAKEDLKASQNPIAVTLSVGGKTLTPNSSLKRTMDLRTGILTTKWSDGGVTVKVESGAGPRSVGARWTVTSNTKVSIQAQPILPSGTAIGAGGTSPYATKRLSAWFFTNTGTAPAKPDADGEVGAASFPASSARTLKCSPNQTAVFSEYVLYPPASEDLRAVRPADALNRLLAGSKPQSWIDIDGPVEDQAAVHRFMYDLTRGEGQLLSPFGLSNTLYNGHVFWDADIWMAPVYDLFDPARIKSLCQYRLDRVSKSAGQPWPWESAVTGKNVAPAMAREIHIVGDVLWQLKQAEALGLLSGAEDKDRLQQAFTVAKAFWKTQMKKNPDGTWSIPNVTSPDENHTGDNDLYTNLLAQWTLNGGSWEKHSALRLKLPKDNISFLTYDDDRLLRTYKQAAAVLSIFPLQFPPAEQEAKTMILRFSDKTIPNGPAMSTSLTSLLMARYETPEKAYLEWRKSWEDNVQGHFLAFSEKKLQDRSIFMTGEAGCLNAVIYGFAGVRIDTQPQAGAQVKVKLNDGQWLSVVPHLPEAWNRLTLHGVWIMGKAYTLTVSRVGSRQMATLAKGTG